MARVARATDARAEGLDEDGGRWYVVCIAHGELVQVTERTTARDDARAANAAGTCAEWCEACRDNEEDQ